MSNVCFYISQLGFLLDQLNAVDHSSLWQVLLKVHLFLDQIYLYTIKIKGVGLLKKTSRYLFIKNHVWICFGIVTVIVTSLDLIYFKPTEFKRNFIFNRKRSYNNYRIKEVTYTRLLYIDQENSTNKRYFSCQCFASVF